MKKRIVIANNTKCIENLLKNSPLHTLFDIEFCEDGTTAKKLIQNNKPHLAIIEVFLPKIHGIELLRWVKSSNNSLTEVIITTYETMLQNYKAALEHGAYNYVEKPLTQEKLEETITTFFSGELKKGVYHTTHNHITKNNDPLKNVLSYDTPTLKLWGTRGSISTSGHQYSKYGGSTSCLEVRYMKSVVIIDAGTGIRELGYKLAKEGIKEIHILLSHTHQDHIQGFPFFQPLYDPSVNIHMYSPVSFEKTTNELFTEMLAYSYFPIRLDQMKANITFSNLRDSERYTFGPICVSCCYSYHPGPTLCFMIHANSRSIGYVTDNEFLAGATIDSSEDDLTNLYDNHIHLLEFLSDCDICIHEAQYTDSEYVNKAGWGHSSITNACRLFHKLQTKRWIVTHHDPAHTDEVLDSKKNAHKILATKMGLSCSIEYAKDMDVIVL